MTGEEFHNKSAGGSQFIATETNARHDGRNKLRPSRVMHAARRGVTLVELMISMLILTIVCISWLQIIGIQSARKEARRREAVERLSGMMDAFLYRYMNSSPLEGGYYVDLRLENKKIDFIRDANAKNVYPMFNSNVSPIGYQLRVVQETGLPGNESFAGWNNKHRWLVGRLFHRSGMVEDAGKPFFTLPVCLGF